MFERDLRSSWRAMKGQRIQFTVKAATKPTMNATPLVQAMVVMEGEEEEEEESLL